MSCERFEVRVPSCHGGDSDSALGKTPSSSPALVLSFFPEEALSQRFLFFVYREFFFFVVP